MLVRVEYLYRDGRWYLRDIEEGRTFDEAKEAGLSSARRLWRSGVSGVRVTVMNPVVVLEHKR